MDLLKAWCVGGIVFLLSNFIISITMGYGGGILYALYPLMAGASAAASSTGES